MKKFLNFSTILFSYVLITLLVISCGGSSGGSSGGGGGTGGNGGNGGGSVPQPEPKDTTCLLVDRADKDSLVAVLCSEGVVIGKITKQNAVQSTKFLIPSTENTAGTTTTSRTWDISKKDAQIQISYNKDYTLTVSDGGTVGPIGTLSDAEGHTAEYPLKILTIPSMLNDVENNSGTDLREGSIVFQSSSSRISVTLKVSLAVKSQADFISMANFSLPELSASAERISFSLVNNLDLVAPGGEAAKFDNAIIPLSDASFDFDGEGYTISLNSEIDTTASGNQAAIIGEIKQSSVFRDFILDINKSISGSRFVGTFLAHSGPNVINKLHGIKVNINSNINAVKMGSDDAHAGGLAGSTCSDISLVVVKTADGVAIRAAAIETVEGKVASIGGVVGYAECYSGGSAARIINSVVDVTLGAYNAGVAYLGSNINMGGLGDRLDAYYEFTNNIVKLKIYRDANLPTNFAFDKVAGLVSRIIGIDEVKNNLAYVDFSNLGQVKNVGGLFGEVDITAAGNDISNNMLFIADGFNPGNVTEKFGAAIRNVVGNGSVLNFTGNFFSSPVTDNEYTNNANIASFVHTANKEINFTNLILDNKEAAVMFKDGESLSAVKNKVTADNLSTFAEGVDSTVATTLKASDQWDAGSGGYPQLIPLILMSDFSDFTNNEIEQAWTATNTDLQAKLAARANK